MNKKSIYGHSKSAAKKMFFMKALLLFFMSISSSCAKNIDQEKEMQFCPKNSESEIRKVLDIQDEKALTIEKLITILEKNNMIYEVASEVYQPLKCENYQDISGAINYKVYAGFDDTKKHTRNFLVVANKDGDIRCIEKNYAHGK